jgi:hypothetical protein
VLQCFHFWFYIDGFLDGAKNESLKVVQVTDKNISVVADIELWSQQSATLGWTEGQVEVRAVLDGSHYLPWRMFMLGLKPGDMTAYVAVDDFRYF